jgi:hypothetical protein
VDKVADHAEQKNIVFANSRGFVTQSSDTLNVSPFHEAKDISKLV